MLTLKYRPRANTSKPTNKGLPGRSQPPAGSLAPARKVSDVVSRAPIAPMYNVVREPARTRFTPFVKGRTLGPCRQSRPTRI